MLLNNCELSPAVILTTKDPKKLGRVKCLIPGIIDSTTMSEENIPWCYPFSMNRYQSFSKPIEGQKVWVIINKSNYNEYWYLPFFEYNEISKEYLEDVYDDDNPEIFMSRCLGENKAMSTYDDKNGFSERIGSNHIDLHPDGHISLLGNDGEVDIDGSIVKCGNQSGSYEPAVLGKTLVNLLGELQKCFAQYAPPTAANPYAKAAGDCFMKCAQILSKANTILAQNVKVN